MKKDQHQLNWLMVSLIAFNMVWGLGNVVNNYSQQGISVVVSWVLILALYFIPIFTHRRTTRFYLQESGSGVSDWVEKTSTKTSRLLCRLDLLGCAYPLSGTKTSRNSNSTWMGLGKVTDNF